MQNFTKTILNAVQKWTKKEIKNSIKNSVADWSQNDETASDYVKNRTHWIEDNRTSIILDNQYINDFQVGARDDHYYVYPHLPLNKAVELGQEYTVLWDGVEYKCELQEVEGGYCLGLEHYYPSWENTNLPFGFFFELDRKTIRAIDSKTGEPCHKIAIYQGSFALHKLDQKYVPNADWNQNDPDGDGYIKNRPFYESVEYIAYVEEQTVGLTSNTNNTWASATLEGTDLPWEGIFRVTIDGTVFDNIEITDNADFAWLEFNLENGIRVQITDYLNITVYNAQNQINSLTVKVERKENIVKAIETKFLGVPVYQGQAETGDTDQNSIRINNIENVASSWNSLASGWHTTASGNTSHAEGSFTTASGDVSHAEGQDTIASGDYSHAEGYETTAFGAYSHAEGRGTITRSSSQHVSGTFNIAHEYYQLQTVNPKVTFLGSRENVYWSHEYTFDHTNGIYTLVDGKILLSANDQNVGLYCMIGGTSGTIMYKASTGSYTAAGTTNRYLYANGIKYDSVTGSYNSQGPLVIVGNGTSGKNRSNAYTLSRDGVGWFQGGLQVGGNAQDDGAKNVLLEGDAIPVPEIAEVGQTMIVSEVDENGKPIAWEAEDSTSGGFVVSGTAPTDTSILWVDTSDDSNDGLQEAVNMALAQAKASGEFDGKDGKIPVKGTDYFTSADKAEMVDSVKAALPTLTITGIDSDGVSHTWTMYGVAQ